MKTTKQQLQKVKVKYVDRDFATESVGDSARRPLYEITLNMAGGPICVAALFAGANLTKGLTLWQTATAVLGGGALLAIYGGILGAIGARTGLSTGMLLRRTFGENGCKVVSAVLALCLVGWFAVQTSFFGDTIQQLFPEGGWLTDRKLAAAWGGILMLLTALWGYRGLSFLSLVAVPLLFGLTVWGLVTAIPSSNVLAYVPAQQDSLSQGVTFVVGALAVSATMTADTTRYASSGGHSWFASFFAYLFTNAFMLLSGAVAAVSTGSGDLLAAMVGLGLGVPALLILALGQWTTNDDNLYSSSWAITASVPRLRKNLVVLALGLAATATALVGGANLFVPFLLFLGIFIPPIGGVVIAQSLYATGDLTGRWNASGWSLPAFSSWALGAVAGHCVPVGIPAVNSIMVSLFAMLVWVRIAGRCHSRKLGGNSAST